MVFVSVHFTNILILMPYQIHIAASLYFLMPSHPVTAYINIDSTPLAARIQSNPIGSYQNNEWPYAAHMYATIWRHIFASAISRCSLAWFLQFIHSCLISCWWYSDLRILFTVNCSCPQIYQSPFTMLLLSLYIFLNAISADIACIYLERK